PGLPRASPPPHAFACRAGATRRFFSDGNVGCTGRDYGDGTAAAFSPVSQGGNHPCFPVIFSGRSNFQDQGMDFPGRSGDNKVRSARHYSLSYPDNMLRGLVFAKYGLGEAATELSMVVNAGIGQVFEREAGQLIQCIVGFGATCPYILQESSDLILVHLDEF